MPTIFVMSQSPQGTLHGRFELQHDEAGPFVVLPGGSDGVKVQLSPDQIKPDTGRMFGADYFCDRPISYPRPEEN
jgi:hypothetical protein